MKIYIIIYMIVVVCAANGYVCSCAWIGGNCDSCELIVSNNNATAEEYPIIYKTNTTNIGFINPEKLVIGKNKSVLIDTNPILDESNRNIILETLNKNFLSKNATATVIVWNQIQENTTGSEENIDLISLYIDNIKINDIINQMTKDSL